MLLGVKLHEKTENDIKNLLGVVLMVKRGKPFFATLRVILSPIYHMSTEQQEYVWHVVHIMAVY